MPMQQIYTSNNLAEALLVQSVLQSHAITVVIENEHTVGIAPHLGIAVGVHVAVHTDDVSRAVKVLELLEAASVDCVDDIGAAPTAP